MPIASVNPATGETIETFAAHDDAEVQLGNESGELRPGMYGRGSIVLAVHPQAAVVPATAAVFTDGKASAFVVDGETVRRRPLTVGVDGGDWLEVLSGVRAGDEVVVAGTESLADGMKIRVSRGVDPFTGAKTAAAAPAASADGKH